MTNTAQQTDRLTAAVASYKREGRASAHITDDNTLLGLQEYFDDNGLTPAETNLTPETIWFYNPSQYDSALRPI